MKIKPIILIQQWKIHQNCSKFEMFKFMITNIKFKGLPQNYQKGNIEKLMEMITLTAIFLEEYMV